MTYTCSDCDASKTTSLPSLSAAGIVFTLNDAGTEYSLTDCTGNATEIVIPSTFEGLPVTSIGSRAFSDCDNLTSIVIPNSVTSIGNYAFYDCDNLTSVAFGENSKLTSIGSYAFYDCVNLTSVIIPDSVTSIGYFAFGGCQDLTSVTFGENSKLTSIGSRAFSDCDNLTSFVIPDGVTSIKSYTFYSCNNLASITISSGVASIAEYAFNDCSNLTTVYFTGTQEEWEQITIRIGNEPLLNANIIFVCDHSFTNNVCSKCGAELNISNDGKFNGVDTTVTGNITVPLASNGALVSTLGVGAFKNCVLLKSVMVYDSVTEIADDAFDGVSENFVIKCYEDSPISVWAEENGVAYEIVPIPYGNVNADGATDIFDLIALAKHTVSAGAPIDIRAANTSAPDKADRNIDIFDLIALAKHICNPEHVLGPKA